jgi:hypothetical protein
MLTNTSRQPDGALACMNRSPGGYESRQFGRRVESDRQWTVYHVFSGVPAIISGHELSGLSRATATASMLWLNHLGIRRGSAAANRSAHAPGRPGEVSPGEQA